MKPLFLLTILLTLTSHIASQEDMSAIMTSSNSFKVLCQQADDYFKNKHPNKSFKDLSIGEYRDGEYVKYMRWQSFWKDHLNPDGTLGDLSSHITMPSASRSSTGNPYDTVTYTNISNAEYITGQISMGRTTSLAFHPTDVNTFYVGAAIGGIWKTTDGGQSYVPLGDDLPYLAVSAIIVDQDNPDVIYIGVSDHVWYGPPGIGVYKSIDGGSTWNSTALNFSFNDNVRIYWLAADPNNSSKLYATTSAGLYVTTDGFSSVSQINTLNCTEVHFKPGDSNTLYFGTHDGRFFRSTNAGGSFSMVNDFGNNYVRITVTALDSEVVFVTHANQLYKSSSSGASLALNGLLPESNVVISIAPNDVDKLVVGNFEVYESIDQGGEFNPITNWLGLDGLTLVHVDQRNIFTNPLQDSLIYLCNDGGVYKYNVDESTFTDLSNGLVITQFYDIAVAQSNSAVVSGGSQDNGSMYRSSAGVWDDLAATGDGMNTEIDPNNENIIYWEYQNGGMRRFNGTNNVGISPSGQDGNGAWETPYRLDPSNPNRLVCGYAQVYESLNQGDSWNSISGDLSNGTNLNHIAIAKSNGERIYAIQGSNLYVKETNSDHWTTKSMPSGSISDIEVDPIDMDKVIITVGGYTSGSKVYLSEDAGDSWTNISGSLPNVPIGAIEIYADQADAYFIGSDLGVFYKDQLLGDWVEYGDFPNTRITDIEIQYNDQLIRVGTHGRGVLEANISIITCTDDDSDIDGDGVCDLFDNCPFLDDNLIGTPCDDQDPLSSEEYYSEACLCEGGQANLTYCSASGSPGTGGDYIDRVVLNDLDHASDKSGYSDFRAISTDLFEDSIYQLVIELNFAFEPDEAYAWIDFDRNGIFDVSEEIIMSTFDANSASQGTFTVPPLTAYGATTMRVRCIYDQPGNNDPCNSYFGEVEDYTINLIDPCPVDKVISKVVYDEEDILSILAENSIALDSVLITTNTNIEYGAGQYIELDNGFCIEAGSEVLISIGGCTN